MEGLTEPVVMGALPASLVGGAAIACTGGQASLRLVHLPGRAHSWGKAGRKEEDDSAGVPGQPACCAHTPGKIVSKEAC